MNEYIPKGTMSIDDLFHIYKEEIIKFRELYGNNIRTSKVIREALTILYYEHDGNKMSGVFFDKAEELLQYSYIEDGSYKSESSIELYYKDLKGAMTPYPNDKVLQLLREYKAGSKTAQEEIILHNQALICSVAKENAFNDDDFLDFVQVGNIALLNAMNGYNENMNILFSTYACVCIKNGIISERFGKYNGMHISKSYTYVIGLISNKQAEIKRDTGENISFYEAYKMLNEKEPLSEKTIELLMDASSLDNVISFNEDNIASLGKSPEEQCFVNEQADLLRSIIATLDIKSRKILEERYKIESPFFLESIRLMPFKEIANLLGISINHARGGAQTGMIKLKKRLSKPSLKEYFHS